MFACAEIAVITMNDARLQKLAASGDKRAVRLSRLTSTPARFLATIQVAITLSGFLGSAFAADNFSSRITDAVLASGATFFGKSINASTLDTVCVILITLILSYFTLVFGELVPKRVAMKKAEQLALALSGLVSFISKVFSPLVWLLTVSTNGILRLFGIDPESSEDNVSEEEIRMMIDVGSQKGTINREEKTMLQNVFEFDDVCAGEIATHRTSVDMLWLDDGDDVWAQTIASTRHSRYPICDSSSDNIIGVLDAKDYYRMGERTRERIMSEAVSAPCFVPESVKADVLFADMKRRRDYFAVVVDEYGGVEGIITMNDLIEQIVGELADEDEEPDIIVESVGEGVWRMSGATPIDIVNDTLHTELPTDDFDTLGGLALSTQSALPPDGATFECDADGLHIKVTKIARRRVREALVSLNSAEGGTTSTEELSN